MAVQGQKVRKSQISVVKKYLQKCHIFVKYGSSGAKKLKTFWFLKIG